MQLTLTNKGREAVPVTSTDEGGWTETLQPGIATQIEKPGSDVIIIGDKPGHLENIAEGLQTVIDFVLRFRDRKQKHGDASELAVEIHNRGANAVRVVPGNVENERELATTEVGSFATRDGYIELRELGSAPQQSGAEAP